MAEYIFIKNDYRFRIKLTNYSLGLSKKAMEYFEQARLTVDFRNRPRDWVAHLARDQMSAWVKAPRFAISDVENVALDAEDRMADGQRGAVSILLRIKMAECFIAFGDRKGRAGKILEPVMAEAERVTTVSYTHLSHPG